jgi:hypothetical protein
MAMERRDPLPPGRYSFVVPVADGAVWKAWTKAHSMTVATVAAVPQKALASNNPFFATDLEGNIIENLVATVVVFDVSSPTPWVGLGFPDIVPGPQTPEAALEWAGKEAESKYVAPPGAGDTLDRVTGLVLIAGGIYLAGVLLSRRREGKV